MSNPWHHLTKGISVMLIIKNTDIPDLYSRRLFRSHLPQFGGSVSDQTMFLDLETTGFSRTSSRICLIGLLFFSPDGYEAVQACISDLNEEAMLISWFLEKCSLCDTLIHFYGNRFDLPFIRHRASLYPECAELVPALDQIDSLDLQEILKPAASLYGLSDRKQASFETYLRQNLQPGCGIPSVLLSERTWPGGRTCVSAFLSYQKTRESRYLDCVFGHNLEDLTGMLSLSAFLPVFQLKDGRFSVENVQSEDSCFTMALRTEEPVDVSFEYEFSDTKLSLQKDLFLFSVRKENQMLRLRYSNYQDYDYLPGEDMAVPKSIGRLLGKGLRKTATPSTCYSWIASEQLMQDDTRLAKQFAAQNLAVLFRYFL